MEVTMCAKTAFEPERRRLGEAVLLFPCQEEQDGPFLRLAQPTTQGTAGKNAGIRGRRRRENGVTIAE